MKRPPAWKRRKVWMMKPGDQFKFLWMPLHRWKLKPWKRKPITLEKIRALRDLFGAADAPLTLAIGRSPMATLMNVTTHTPGADEKPLK